MKCPVDDTTLMMTDRNGVEIDYCPTCRGVWLDRGELDKIIDRAAADAGPVVALAEPAAASRAQRRDSAPPPQAARRHAGSEDDRAPRDDRRREDDDRRRADDDDRPYRKKRRESFLSELFDF